MLVQQRREIKYRMEGKEITCESGGKERDHTRKEGERSRVKRRKGDKRKEVEMEQIVWRERKGI